jgi:diguanylate cyclase (GGDEF)-like protein/PAS domain S-box-containing protein
VDIVKKPLYSNVRIRDGQNYSLTGKDKTIVPDLSFILWTSVLLQAVAVVLALRLIPVTGRALAWTLLSIAFVLMASRRTISLLHEQGIITSNWLHALSAESVALMISVLMVFGIVLIRGIFKQQQANAEQLQKLSLAIEQNPSSTIISDIDRIIEYVNPRFCELTGYRPGDVLGKTISSFTAEHTPAAVLDGLWETVSSGKVWKGELCNKCKNGDVKWERACVAPARNPDGAITHYVAVMEDITEQHQQREALEHMAMHDSLTGLPNRTLFFDRLKQGVLTAAREHEALAVMLMDLDNFKEINDTLGHHIGDRILREIAQRLTEHTALADTVARMGGDEFMILLNATSPDQADEFAAAAIEKIRQPIQTEGYKFEVTASIGYAMYPEDGLDVEVLVQNADIAMYASKRTGTRVNRYVEALNDSRVSRLQLIGDLRAATEGDQFFLQYQPKFRIRSGKIEGVEALIRWRHPQFGVLYPDEFIQLAEDSGNIGLISRWVLTKAVEKASVWQRAKPGLAISVNISARDLQEPTLPEFIACILKDHHLSPALLNLEITESALMLYTEQTFNSLMQLRDIGIKLSIDDFGTGYSSLQHLKDLPVSELKIDKSFVMHMTTNEDDAVIVRSTIDLAHNLGLEVVAEGIEDQETYDILEVLDCDCGQGFHIARPLDESRLAALLTTTKN